jgi:glycosyltransferase involved in cell wall biosynthesis
MKVLMFGWEFPPHISGGLGTACYGLTKGLTGLGDVEIVFVVPKAFGDEDQSEMELVGANKIPVAKSSIHFDDIQKKIEYFEIESKIIPYVGEEEFLKLQQGKYTKSMQLIETGDGYLVNFNGGYKSGLMTEIQSYSVVAEIIAGEKNFDIIHAHDWLAYPAGIAVKKITGKPLVVHVHATEYDRSGENLNQKVYAIEREGMEMADKIIAVSNLTKSIIIEKYGIRPGKIVTVHNAVEADEINSEVLPKKGVNEKIVTFLGRITMQKGPEYFVEAANLILQKMSNVRFVMAGSGDLLNPVIERIAELGISDRFHFTGFLKGSDVKHMFGITDVFVMPSVSEPFGIVPLEAMQARVPIIISNQSGVSEIVKNALKVDFWDTFAMADAIYGLLNYPSLAKSLIEDGKKEVGKLKWKNSAKKVRKVYQSLLK